MNLVEVHFAEADKTVFVQPGTTLLEAAEMASLDVQAEEVEAKAEALGKRGLPVAAMEARMTRLAELYLQAKARMTNLIDEPDMATGHAFVVFNYEVRVTTV